ncbi:tyrosine-type recombinase/integrase [Nitratireductor aquimarinus]|uniref:tyrosine-type recombinase/integrase n=1 Tax=Nitratireductor aquimarinus TaxID=889300 RepID=UPI0029360315|nr:tyrosine-type recombinase/integrase [Nitratireductor aquimarinus]MDV2965999.1 tyrosine-type recombinase/integrase [Nitratireductor aquimarinus]
MGLVLKYVIQTKSGAYHYRRRVPKHLKDSVGKRELKRFLGKTQTEALAKYPQVHTEFERQLRQAESKINGLAHLSSAPLSDLERYYHLIKRLQELGVDPFEVDYDENGLPIDDAHRGVVADSILDSYPRDKRTGDPVGVSKEDAALVRALYGRLPNRPSPTLEDAKKLYLEYKIGIGSSGTDDPRHRERIKTRQRLERVTALAIDALGGDLRLTDIRRKQARDVLDRLKSEYKPATGRRYLNDLKAMINHAILEEELNIASPFQGLTIQVEGSGKEERTSFTEAELKAIRGQLDRHGNAELQMIWALLEYSGCRLSEISKLMKTDLFIQGEEIPYIHIQANDRRGIKTASSIREIPLIGEALETVLKALNLSGDSPFLFPHYGSVVGDEAASQALMKHVRKVTSDPKKVVHSLRHTLTDRLRIAGVSEEVISVVLGHKGHGMTSRYGGREARLKRAVEALSRLT